MQPFRHQVGPQIWKCFSKRYVLYTEILGCNSVVINIARIAMPSPDKMPLFFKVHQNQ